MCRVMEERKVRGTRGEHTRFGWGLIMPERGGQGGGR